MTDQPTTSRPPAYVWPTLAYRDAAAAIRFLVDAFGFEKGAAHAGANDEQIVHAELRWPLGGGVMLGTAEREGSVMDIPAGVGSVYVVTREPDALYDQAVAAGARVVRSLRDEDYGSRGFTVRDPQGVLWSFGTYAGE